MEVLPRILYISSADPLHGPGAIGMSHYQHLKNAGYEVDMITTYPVNGFPEIIPIKKKLTLKEWLLRKVNGWLNIKLPGYYPQASPYFFFYKNEEQPPVSIDRILKKINKEYDLLIVYYWQGLLSFHTLDVLYEKTGHPLVYFISPDYSHMSGGCHFPGNCRRFQTGCGCCPAFRSHDKNDFTHQNVLYREQIYEKIKPIVFGNTYMCSFYSDSYLLKNARVVKSRPVIDSEVFHPIDKCLLREKYKVGDDVSFIIAFGCQKIDDERKGFSYFVEALNIFSDSLQESQKKNVLLLLVGNEYEAIQSKLPFRSIGLGTIPFSQLSEFYSLADIFVCSSINDAGPSMVGQSIACGTPVVGFEMGALLDWVLGRETGYCAKVKDSKDLAEGIKIFFNMSIAERNSISAKCRHFASQCSRQSSIEYWIEVYQKYKSNKLTKNS